jgi:microcystin-dependent protein
MIQTDISSISYVGNGSTTTPYIVPFYFLTAQDLVVVVLDSDNVETLQTLGTHYTVTGAGNVSGGEITFTWAVPSSSQVSISRSIEATQLTSYEEADSFPAKSHERALDKLTMLCQQNARLAGGASTDLGQAFRLTQASGGINAVSKIPNTLLGLDDGGNVILRTPTETLAHLGQVGLAWANDSERMGTRGAYAGQLGVQLDNQAIYEALSTEPGDWEPFLRHDGLVTALNGAASAVPLPAGDVVGTDQSQVLLNKTLITPSITNPTGLDKFDVGLGEVDNTSDEDKPVSVATVTALLAKQDTAQKGASGGYASLDGGGKVPLAQIPDAVLGANQYKGTWNASTNSPSITTGSAPGKTGWYYSVSVAGTTTVDGISSWAVGDQIISNGTIWQKIVNVSAVSSVNTKTGAVVLVPADINLGNVDNTSDAQKNAATATLTNKTINGANNTLTVRLDADVTNNLPTSRLNNGTGATGSTWWCGDGSWKAPSGTGDVTGVASSVTGELAIYGSASGKALGKYAGVTGFAKIAPNTAVTAVAEADLIHSYPTKLFLNENDEFLIWDSQTSTLKRVRRAIVGNPVGTILDFAGNTVPVDYLLCDGSLKSKTTYSALYAVIADLWGTGDASNFRLPDLRGFVLAGKDNMGGSDAGQLSTLGAAATTVGGSGGSQVHTLTEAQLPFHTHNYSLTGFVGGSYGAAGTYWSPNQTPTPSGGTGGNAAHNNLQPIKIVNKIIRY